ncbi:hypothetical protein AEA09_18905 [Lysinibacillus contaminans]|uniref:DUF3953 domain-containing protein n=1 Tax=Lysinibacillus contaminans TaxID=1293441 RepID=A0ABR5JVX9_9BACI|nr:hypothetical protein AEA09_18905 [Lysinibacillus contaminans]
MRKTHIFNIIAGLFIIPIMIYHHTESTNNLAYYLIASYVLFFILSIFEKTRFFGVTLNILLLVLSLFSLIGSLLFAP